MAEENESEIENENEVAKGVGGTSRTTILAGIIMLILGSLGGVFIPGFIGCTDPAPTVESSEDAPSEKRVMAKTTTYDLGEFSLNLKDPSTMRILQMSIVVECESEAVIELKKRHAQIRDVVIMFTSEYTVPSLTGLEGKMNLRDEVLMRINAIMKPHRVERIYFTKFIIGK